MIQNNMQEHINELVEILTNTEGITYITQRIVKTQVHFSFIFESYKVLDDLKKKMPEDWFLFIVGSHNICYLSYKQSNLERYFELLQLVKAAFFLDDFINIFCNKH